MKLIEVHELWIKLKTGFLLLGTNWVEFSLALFQNLSNSVFDSQNLTGSTYE